MDGGEPRPTGWSSYAASRKPLPGPHLARESGLWRSLELFCFFGPKFLTHKTP